MATTKRPYAQPDASRRNVYMDQETWNYLKKLGKGNASEGIRVATKAMKQSIA